MPARPPRPWLLAACYLLLYAGAAFAFPFMTIYLGTIREVSPARIGVYLSLCQLAAALGQGLGGAASDRFGPNRVMTAALALRAGLAALLAVAIQTGSVPQLVAVHVAHSLFGSFFEPASRAWVAQRYGPSERLEVFAFLRLPTNLGWAIGPALGALFALAEYGRLFAVTAAATAACAFLVARLPRAGVPPPPSPQEPPEAPASASPRFLAYCALTALISLVMAQLVVGLSLHATRHAGLTHREVGALFMLNGLMVVAFQTRLTEGFSKARLTTQLALGSALYAAAYALVGWSTGLALLAVAMVILTVGEMLASPPMSTLAANMAPASRRGRYLGLHGFAHQLGLAAGPLVGGTAQSAFGGDPRLPWAGIGGLALLSAWGFVRPRPALERREDLPGS